MDTDAFSELMVQMVIQNRTRLEAAASSFEVIVAECVELHTTLASTREAQAAAVCNNMIALSAPIVPQCSKGFFGNESSSEGSGQSAETTDAATVPVDNADGKSQPALMHAVTSDVLTSEFRAEEDRRLSKFTKYLQGFAAPINNVEPRQHNSVRLAKDITPMKPTLHRVSSTIMVPPNIPPPGPPGCVDTSEHPILSQQMQTEPSMQQEVTQGTKSCKSLRREQKGLGSLATSPIIGLDSSHMQVSERNRDKIRCILSVDRSCQMVTQEQLYAASIARGSSIPLEAIHKLIEYTWKLIQSGDNPLSEHILRINFEFLGDETTTEIPFEVLPMIVEEPEVIDLYRSSEACFGTMHEICRMLSTTTLQDVVHAATKFEFTEQSNALSGRSFSKETTINTIVFITTGLSLMAVGTSLDWKPGHYGWIVFESSCLLVYLLEVWYKVHTCGLSRFFQDPKNKYWNWLDCTIIAISGFELSLSTFVRLEGAAGRFGNVIGLLRMFYIARVLRLVKLFRSGVGKEVANIILCCTIGIYALVSCLGIFVVVLFLLGLMCRVFLGPAPGQDLLSLCGDPDDLPDWDSVECRVHLVYGEVYFNSVKTGMFTVFRFMMGDFSSVNDRNIVLAMSKGYGSGFDVVFVIFMISVYFGLFNVITAVFVESTIAGLKHSDAKRKQVQQYEKKFVQEKLMTLLETIITTAEAERSPVITKMKRRSLLILEDTKPDYDPGLKVDSVQVSQTLFCQIFSSSQALSILKDLDIEMLNPNQVYDTLDPEGFGVVSLPDVVLGLMKLRGEPSKNDLIANLQAIMSLHEKIDKIAGKMEANERKTKPNKNLTKSQSNSFSFLRT